METENRVIQDQLKENKESSSNRSKFKSYLAVIGKGVCVGGSMLVPGVSGGSMAMILGIYDKLIDAVSSFFKHIAWSIKFLAAFCISAVIGMIVFAKPLLGLIERFPMVMLYFFIGAVFGSVPMIIKKAEVKKFNWGVIVYPIIGLLMMGGIALLPTDLLSGANQSGILSYLPILIAGIVIAVALVLPGISVSYMLLVLGLYEETMKAISELDIGFLMPLALGLGLGIILTTKLLEQAMKKQPGPTYLIILGFILASCIDIFPGIPSGATIIFAILLFIIGAIIMYRLSEWEDSI